LNSETYGKYFSIELNAQDGLALYIPIGFAHGFLTVEDNSIVNYAQTSCYSREHDAGIRYDSFEFKWGVSDPVMSERDVRFISFKNFSSPFTNPLGESL